VRAPADRSLLGTTMLCEEWLAEALAQQGDGTGALELARKAMAQTEKVSEPDPDRALLWMARAYRSLAKSQAALGEWSDARAAAEHAVAAYKQVAASGKGLARQADVAGAEALLQECVGHSH